LLRFTLVAFCSPVVVYVRLVILLPRLRVFTLLRLRVPRFRIALHGCSGLRLRYVSARCGYGWTGWITFTFGTHAPAVIYARYGCFPLVTGVVLRCLIYVYLVVPVCCHLPVAIYYAHGCYVYVRVTCCVTLLRFGFVTLTRWLLRFVPFVTVTFTFVRYVVTVGCCCCYVVLLLLLRFFLRCYPTLFTLLVVVVTIYVFSLCALPFACFIFLLVDRYPVCVYVALFRSLRYVVYTTFVTFTFAVTVVILITLRCIYTHYAFYVTCLRCVRFIYHVLRLYVVTFCAHLRCCSRRLRWFTLLPRPVVLRCAVLLFTLLQVVVDLLFFFCYVCGCLRTLLTLLL